MIEKLNRTVAEAAALHSKLVLLVAGSEKERSSLLHQLAERHGASILNIGSELGAQLVPIPIKHRTLSVPTILRSLAERHAANGLLFLDNIELLFDRNLQLDPLDLLKQLARVRTTIVAWPGRALAGRLTYADAKHPERRDYNPEGLVLFEIK